MSHDTIFRTAASVSVTGSEGGQYASRITAASSSRAVAVTFSESERVRHRDSRSETVAYATMTHPHSHSDFFGRPGDRFTSTGSGSLRCHPAASRAATVTGFETFTVFEVPGFVKITEQPA